MTPLLIATDVDGTLIDDAERVPRPVVEVLQTAVARGITVVLATGRPPRWVFPVIEQLGFSPVCVCANGAVVYDSANDAILSTVQLSPETLRSVVRAASEAMDQLGGAHFAVERAGRSAFDATEKLFAVSPDYSHAWESVEYGVEDVKQLCSTSAIKLLVRNEHVGSHTIAEVLQQRLPEDLVHVTYSMSGGLVEISAPGVTKARGLASVAEHLGISSTDVVAFGDMPNDIEMLQWAGKSYAVANARDSVKTAAELSLIHI